MSSVLSNRWGFRQRAPLRITYDADGRLDARARHIHGVYVSLRTIGKGEFSLWAAQRVAPLRQQHGDQTSISWGAAIAVDLSTANVCLRSLRCAADMRLHAAALRGPSILRSPLRADFGKGCMHARQFSIVTLAGA